MHAEEFGSGLLLSVVQTLHAVHADLLSSPGMQCLDPV